MEAIGRSQLSARDVLFVIFRHKVSIAVIFLVCLTSVAAWAYMKSEIYLATSKVLVKVGRENQSTPVVLSSQQFYMPVGITKEDIYSEIEILQNRFIAEDVVNRLGAAFFSRVDEAPQGFLKRVKHSVKGAARAVREAGEEVLYALDLRKRLSNHDAMVLRVQRGLSAKQVRNSNVIEIGFLWWGREEAVKILETAVDVYLQNHLSAHRIYGGYEFFEKQAELIGARLSEAEEGLQALQRSEKITSLEDDRRLILEQTAGIRSSLKAAESELAAAMGRIKELRAQLSSQPEMIRLNEERNANPVVQQLKMRLLEYEAQKRVAESKYREGSVPLSEINRSIAEIRGRLSREDPEVVGSRLTGSNSIYKDVQKELVLQEVRVKELMEREKVLKGQLESNYGELERIAEAELKVKRLRRQIQSDEENYIFYKKKLEESRISQVLDEKRIVNVSVIEPPSAGYTPVFPKRLMLIGAGALVGLLAGAGYAFGAEYADHTLKREEDVVSRLGLPVLASISESGVEDILRQEYGALKNRLLSAVAGRGLRTIMVTGPSGGEGSSTLAENLARSLAQNRALRVLLVDADLRSPSLGKRLGAGGGKGGKGFSELLAGEAALEEAVRSTGIENLSFMPAGAAVSPGLLEGVDARKAVEEIGAGFDFAIFDSTHVNPYPDACILAQCVGAVVLVVRAGSTRWEVAGKAMGLLASVHANLLGAVLNGKRRHIPEFIYARI